MTYTDTAAASPETLTRRPLQETPCRISVSKNLPQRRLQNICRAAKASRKPLPASPNYAPQKRLLEIRRSNEIYQSVSKYDAAVSKYYAAKASPSNYPYFPCK